MAAVDWKKFIKASDLLGSLSRAEIERLLKPGVSEQKTFSAGEEIVRQDEKGRSFYLIGAGSVAITRPAPEGGEINLAVLENGDFFGEMALLSRQPRTATVKAREDCVVLGINADDLMSVLEKHPEILTKIFMILSERLRDLAERVVDVSYNEVNNKLELFSTKLDAELKAMNSTLAATQVVFDQTTKQANEVITSTERHWKRLTMVGSLVTSMLVGVLGWFGFTNYQDFVTSTENARLSIMSNAKEVEAHKLAIGQVAENAEGLTQRLKEQYLALRSGATYSVVPILQNLGTRNPKGAQYYLPILQSNLKLVLSSDDENSTTIVFKELYNWMTRTLVNAGKETKIHSFQSQADFIFTGILESEHQMPLRNRALCYYFLLANLAIEQNNSEFDIRLNELDKVLRDRKEEWIILDDDKKHFEPQGFALAIYGLDLPQDKVDEINTRIAGVWDKIANP